MASIDVTRVLRNPRFLSSALLIRRAVAVNGQGEAVITEDVPINIQAAIQSGGPPQVLARLPTGTRLHDVVTIHYAGRLQVAGPGAYADMIVVDGDRYQIQEVTGDYMNHGQGFCSAVALRESANP